MGKRSIEFERNQCPQISLGTKIFPKMSFFFPYLLYLFIYFVIIVLASSFFPKNHTMLLSKTQFTDIIRAEHISCYQICGFIYDPPRKGIKKPSKLFCQNECEKIIKMGKNIWIVIERNSKWSGLNYTHSR